MTSPTLPPLREVIAQYGLGASKSLGQHFLLDLNLTDKIARAGGDLHACDVIEVGPGPGGLTRALLKAGAHHVIAIERDRRFLPALADIAAAYPGRLTVVHEDALASDEAALARGRPIQVIANLPYNVATALLVKWLSVSSPWYTSLVLMFQKEVAARLAAKPGTKAYGRLTILSQWRADVTALFDIPARAFTPSPKVDSTVVKIVPRPCDTPALGKALERVTEAAFGQRRKMLRASLKSLVADPEALLAGVGLDPKKRAEELSVGDFVRLAQAWQKWTG